MTDEEYEVESILQAKVVKQRKQLMWQFRVRWKGYSPDDDTWEPMESFEGSLDVMNNFWERANTGGRNYLDLNLFKAGEVFLPTGPPRRKKRQSLSTTNVNPVVNPVASAINSESHSASASPSEKRKRSQSPQLEPSTRLQKRAREALHNGSTSQSVQFRKGPGLQGESASKQARSSQRATKRTSSLEIVPDSDEETEHTLTIQDPSPKPILPARPASNITASKLLKNLHRDRPDQLLEPRAGTQKDTPEIVTGAPEEELDPLSLPVGQVRATSIPSHKTKATNPLVKQAGDAVITRIEGAINTKARLMNQIKQESTKNSFQASRPRPGPGRSSAGMIQKNRSSLLTAEKGVLKTVKGKYTWPKQVPEAGGASEPQGVADDVQQEVVNGAPPSAPDQAVEPVSGLELLQLATGGTTLQDADILPAFEEATAVPDPSPTIQEPSISIPPPHPTPSSRSKFLPFGALPELRTIGNHVERTSSEKASAFIQDMLFAGNISSSWNRTIFEKPNTSSALQLAVDHSRSIPMRLKSLDSHAQGAQKWGSITQRNPNAPLGKFYSANNAHLIMNTLRTCDITASVDVDPTATAEQVALFQQFQDRLKAGYLFIAMAGPDVLAFCFSRSVDIASKLNIPAGQREDDGILVARVTIESYTEYADATIFSEAW